jgi:hypothetical protein
LDLYGEVQGIADAPDAGQIREPIRWDAKQANKTSDDYKTCVMLPFVGCRDWTPKTAYALNIAFKREFGLANDTRWIGLVKSGKEAGATHDSPFHQKAATHLAFLVHEDDASKLYNGHRLDLGFRWFFDVVAPDNGMSRRFPRRFKAIYNL